MVVRKRRKKNKLRGKRSHGKGNTKNKRGAGCRGGRGMAGSHKHKYSKYYKKFGQKHLLKSKGKATAINLDDFSNQLNKWLEEKKIEKTAKGLEIDGKKVGVEKILGMGNIKEKVFLKNIKVSKKALEKITEAGGKIEGIEAKAAEEEFEAEKTESEGAEEVEEKESEKETLKETETKEEPDEKKDETKTLKEAEKTETRLRKQWE